MLKRVSTVRERLDALREGRVRTLSLRDRALALIRGTGELPRLRKLETLSREFDRAGVRTLADAKLLQTLGLKKGRAGQVAAGLDRRAAEALAEFESALLVAERSIVANQPLPGASTALERLFPELVRVCRTAALFAKAPEAGAASERFHLQPDRRPSATPPISAHLAAAEFYAERARANVEDVLAKRRDLDRAHDILLRIEGRLERERMLQVRREVADARERIRTLAPARSLGQLLREVRRELPRDSAAAYRNLHGLYERAVEAGAEPLAAAASRALHALARGDSDDRLAARLESDAEALVRASGETAAPGGQEERLTNLAFALTPEELERFELAAGCARFFDVEESLAEEVIEGAAKRRTPRSVPYPTQSMTFEPTGHLDAVHQWVISDPRRVIFDLASHQQLRRVYLEDEPTPVKRAVKRTAVRVYVLDASGSMFGERARFRDAILIAELNNIRAKALKGEPFEPLYYTYFNDSPTELTRIDSASSATRHIQKLFANAPATGQTDITLALMSAFDSIRSAQGRDPHLARATVVLVTDGEDKVDLELVRKIRAPIHSLDIALSFIALGEENPDLRILALEQRAQGSRGFYHHLSDQEIGWARTEFDTPWRTLLPRELDPGEVAFAALEPHLVALESIAAGRGPGEVVITDVNFDALFPETPFESPARVAPELLERVRDILSAIFDVATLAPLAQRPVEAVTLLEHLRRSYGIELSAYLASLRDPVTAALLAKVRLVCAPIQ